MRSIYAALPLIGFGTLAALSSAASGPFPYRGPVFDSFVHRSYEVARRPKPAEFYQWMDRELKAAQGRTWSQVLAAHRKALKVKDRNRRASAELDLATDLHRALKKTIRKFSLDRGFEFTNTVTLGERQCFLQSIVIAGLLQRAGVDAGVAMVWKNPQGQTSNNGHACVVAKLSNGHDVTVDASDPTPFIEHQGLFMTLKSARDYRFLEPTYAADHMITNYRILSSGKVVAPAALVPLDVPFLRSQFDYYRGERAIDGILDKSPTPAGLKASEAYFRASLKESAGNPLTRAMLAATLKREGRGGEAKAMYVKAKPIYARYGWVPDGVQRGTEN